MKKDLALVGYPIFLTVSLITAVLTMTFLYITIENLHRNIEIREIEKQLSIIISKAETMSIYANNISIQTLQIHFPSSLQLVVLGGIPSNTGRPIITNKTCNQYYYMMKDGTIKIYHSKICFSSENNDAIILTPGMHTITLKIYEKNRGSYVTVYERQ